jgi:hypothetical protein
MAAAAKRVTKASGRRASRGKTSAGAAVGRVSPAGTSGGAGAGPASVPEDSAWTDKLESHRARQASVSSILDATFGRLAQCSPDLWGYRAYLLLVGMVYERLALNENEISTDELVALAKVIAENRRLEVRLREMEGDSKPSAPCPKTGERLPDSLNDAVRQVYGTNLQDPST